MLLIIVNYSLLTIYPDAGVRARSEDRYPREFLRYQILSSFLLSGAIDRNRRRRPDDSSLTSRQDQPAADLDDVCRGSSRGKQNASRVLSRSLSAISSADPRAFYARRRRNQQRVPFGFRSASARASRSPMNRLEFAARDGLRRIAAIKTTLSAARLAYLMHARGQFFTSARARARREMR